MKLKYKTILLSVLVVTLALMTFSYSQLPFYPPECPAGPSINPGDRLLIVAPHPDDEVICNGGIIGYAVEHQVPLKVVVVTDGNDTKTSPVTRHNESINGTKILGLKEEDIIFLGYKDGSLRILLNDHWEIDNPFTASDGSKQINYPYALEKNGTYSGSSLTNNLKTIITDFKPTIIVYPSGDDEQFDHQATSGFTELATTQTRYNGSKYTYLLHLPPNWPSPRSYYPEYYLIPPTQLVGMENGPQWSMFNLTTHQQRLKEESFQAYRTQIVPSSYLLSFLRKNELFAEYSTINVSPSNFNENNYTRGLQVPPLLFVDTVGDGKYHGKEKPWDITSVGMDINKDVVTGKSWISLKTAGEPSSSAVYNVHLYIPNPEGIERVKISVESGVASLEREGSDNSTSEEIPLKIKNNTMIMGIPGNIFKNNPYLILSAETIKSGGVLDQTPWRIIKVNT